MRLVSKNEKILHVYFVAKKKTCVFILYIYIYFLFWESNLWVDKVIWKLTGEWPYFLGNVLVGVIVVFLLYCPLVLSLLKHRSIGTFLNQKKKKKTRILN